MRARERIVNEQAHLHELVRPRPLTLLLAQRALSDDIRGGMPRRGGRHARERNAEGRTA